MGSLEGQRALISGAGSGIGAAIATALASEGAQPILVGRDHARLEEVAAQVGDRAETAVCDVTDEAAVERLAAGAGRVDLLVNNVGGAESEPLTRTDIALWRRMLEVNATTAFLMCRAFAPAMVERRGGRIVNVASTAGERGYPYVTAYCAGKHALIGLTRALALELAGALVTVNAVCPGYTEAGTLERAVQRIVVATGRDADSARRELLGDNPLGRFVRPEEVASAVAWLCAPMQAAVTGRTITVAGGEVV
jgi:NAD(P)-dependent dehydrogenase (short-subunit alcohol dehydrogenase family)